MRRCIIIRDPLLSVILGVPLRSVFMMLGRMQGMAVRHFGMMRRFLMIAGLCMLGRFAMVLGRVIVVIRRFLVMLVNVVVIHCRLPQ
jgi:hypothetical protein